MDWIRILMSRLAAFFRTKELDDDLDEELGSHLEFAIEENLLRGMSEQEAKTAALLRFGGVTQIKETYRVQRGIPFLERLERDVTCAAQQLRKSPGFTLTAVITLALGIGANSTVFGVLNAVLLQPLPFDSPDRLVRIQSIRNRSMVDPSVLDTRDFAVWNHTFDRIAVWNTWPKNIAVSKGVPEQREVGLASEDFFDVLRLRPILGRMFTPAEAQPGRNHVALITEAFWLSHYAGDPGILGRCLVINGDPYSIVGVLPDTIPAWFRGVSIQIWEPFLPFPTVWEERDRGARGYGAIGRLKAGVTTEQAQADLARVAEALGRSYPIDNNLGVAIEPLIEVRAGSLRPTLLLLMTAVTLILLLACSNLAALLLARNTARQREFSMKVALGASRMGMIREVLAESLLLSLSGGAFGIGLAWASVDVLRHRHPILLPQLALLSIDWRVLLFTLVLAVGTSILFGLAPGVLCTRINIAESLKEGGRSGGGPQRESFRKMLVIGQIALSLMLMVGAGLLMQTIVRLQNQDIGFRPDHLVRAQFYLPTGQYSSPSSITEFCERFVDRLRALPGVRDASITTIYPPLDDWTMMFSLAGHPVSRIEDVPTARFGVSDKDFLKTAGIPLVTGRDFSEADKETTPPVAIVNQAFVKEYFPHEDPLGKMIELGTPRNLKIQDAWLGNRHPEVIVVGVMRDWKNQGLASLVEPQIVTLFKQSSLNFGFKSVLVRTEADPRPFLELLQKELHSMDPLLPVYSAGSMTDYLADQTSDKSFTTALLIAFAMLGAVLAVVGVYGVVSYLVVQRQQELGVRLALGATRLDVLWLIVRQGIRLAVSGTLIGLAGVAIASRSLSSLLFGVSALDIFTLSVASAFLLFVALVASVIPARRAASIDPMQALRNE